MKKIDYKNVKNIALIAKNGQNLERDVDKISKILSKFDAQIFLEQKTAQFLGKTGQNLREIARNCEILISLGGDGTLLGACRETFGENIAILGVNTGRLGFLTDINIDDTKQFFDEFFSGKFIIECPLMLEISLKSADKIIKKIAFNDMVLMRSKIKSIANIDAFLDGAHFNSYFGDGVIVTSPIGSTAYNLSAGGPIIFSLCDVFCVTPVCSHSLTQRALVLPNGANLSFKSSDDIAIVIDGQENYKMSEFDEVCVTIGKSSVMLLGRENRDYFNTLKEKLNWGHQ